MDYDGDALNCYLIMDQKMLDLFHPFDLRYSVPDLSRPYAITGFLTLLSTGNVILSNYLQDKRDVGDDSVIKNMKVIEYVEV